MRENAMNQADRETRAYMQRQGISAYAYRFEPAVAQEVDAFWNACYQEAMPVVEEVE